MSVLSQLEKLHSFPHTLSTCLHLRDALPVLSLVWSCTRIVAPLDDPYLILVLSLFDPQRYVFALSLSLSLSLVRPNMRTVSPCGINVGVFYLTVIIIISSSLVRYIPILGLNRHYSTTALQLPHSSYNKKRRSAVPSMSIVKTHRALWSL